MTDEETTDEQGRKVELPKPPDFNDTPAALRAIYYSQLTQGAAINNMAGKIRRIDTKISEHKALEEKVEVNKAKIAEHQSVVNITRWAGRISGVAFILWVCDRLFG